MHELPPRIRPLAVLITLPFLFGCGASVRPVPANKPLEADRQSELRDILATWASREEDRAARQLLAIEWKEPGLTSGMAALSVSEEEFMSLPRNERNRIQEEAMKLVETSRALARHAISLGEKAQASGDTQGARAYFQAVDSLGQALSKPERLMVLQMFGQQVSRMGNEALSALD